MMGCFLNWDVMIYADTVISCRIDPLFAILDMTIIIRLPSLHCQSILRPYFIRRTLASERSSTQQPPIRINFRTIVNSSNSKNTMSSDSLATKTIQNFCDVLSSKQPTPGGGASAAIGAAIGAGTAAMSASYTQRKKDEESGAADAARAMIAKMDLASLLAMADDDVIAYKSLQSTWKKDSGLTPDQKKEIEANALRVPTVLLEACHERILGVGEFLPLCNSNITSDAKVGIHQLAGAARSAYQTVLVNYPPEEEKLRLQGLLKEIQEIENGLLGF